MRDPDRAKKSKEGHTERLLLTIAEAAQALAISRAKLYELIGQNQISVCRIGRSVRLARLDIEHYIERLRQEGQSD